MNNLTSNSLYRILLFNFLVEVFHWQFIGSAVKHVRAIEYLKIIKFGYGIMFNDLLGDFGNGWAAIAISIVTILSPFYRYIYFIHKCFYHFSWKIVVICILLATKQINSDNKYLIIFTTCLLFIQLLIVSLLSPWNIYIRLININVYFATLQRVIQLANFSSKFGTSPCT